MASYKAFWYTDEANLRHFGRQHLKALLDNYAVQLQDAGIVIEEPKDLDEYYRKLTAVFLRPEGIPTELHEALYFIKALDNDNGLNRIAHAVSMNQLTVDMNAETSIADKALQAWLQDETLVKGLHVEIGLDASRSFVHFKPTYKPVPAMNPLAHVRKAFEQDLSLVFQAHGRGTFCEIEQHIRNHEHVFVMRHGDPYRRDTELKQQAAVKPLYYWPGVQDLVVYNAKAKTMRMNVHSPWHKRAYAQNFGKHLFGDPGLFIEKEVFTLEPLRAQGRAILNGTMYGIEEIGLVELQTVADEELNDMRIRRSKDVFTSYERENGIPDDEKIKQASFRVRFAGAKSFRTVMVSGSRARYTQDHNGRHVTEWLIGTGIAADGRIDDSDVEDGDGADGME